MASHALDTQEAELRYGGKPREMGEPIPIYEGGEIVRYFTAEGSF